MINKARMDAPIAVTCGQLIVGGFEGTQGEPFARALAAGRRGGAVLFQRNLGADVRETAALNARLAAAAPRDMPPLIAVDQEGGRVARIGAPALRLPPMRALAAWMDAKAAESIAERQGVELAALGFTMNFAPVLDVDSNPANPVIGDRAFSASAEVVAELGVAWARGLARGGVLACGKHFPGHGDTHTDSHIELPVVTLSREELEPHLLPFARAAQAEIAAIMTAHVVCRALDPELPATLSFAICSELRRKIGFRGILFSDDLEMNAITSGFGVAQAAVRAIEAGCDAVLVCASEERQEEAHAALVRRAEADPAFRARCEDAARRGLLARRRVPPRPLTDAAALARVFEASREVAERVARSGAP
jgi:beta-N-acetylhexosaminidase